MLSDLGTAGVDQARGSVWSILVVDDEKDVHEVTHLALKRKHWRKRPFELTSCHSAREARELLKKGPSRFQVALVDVVMETQHAGLDLCHFIRAECPSSLRIILRTGQPGVAPEERVINDYDIDYYLAKAEVTPDKLFATVRSCIRSSQDIETLLAFSRQLRQFTSALQHITSEEDLAILMNEGLRFLALKHQVRITFLKNLDESATTQAEYDLIRGGHERGLELGKMHPAGDEQHMMLFAVRVEGSELTVRGGFLVGAVQPGVTAASLQSDLVLFMQNWTIAHGALLLQQRVAREKMLNERMYIERIEGIANMVTGVAHEINTPLGVANTANGMIQSLSEQIAQTAPGSDLDALVADLRESTGLLGKNLDRATRLVRSFKQLSASQLSDERVLTDLGSVVSDCLDAMRVETKKRGLQVAVGWGPDAKFPWVGYPGHFSQVLVNLVQNTLRYAYPAETPAPRLDIRLSDAGESYVLEFEDHGAGVAPEIQSRMFQPFVTSTRGSGGTGLGLAISHNIMTNILKGKISFTTVVGRGTKFVLTVPKDVPE
jgi:signal transduction histidine kinase/DNA-binding response OmpR family regulator